MRPSRRTAGAFAAALGTACALEAGCAVGPDFKRPEAPAVRSYTAQPTPEAMTAGGKSQQLTEGGAVAADWWRLLGCPELDAIVAESLQHNPSLEAAQASLRRSQDSLRAGYGVFFPQLDAQAGGSRQQSTPLRFGVTAPSSVYNLFTLSATVSYTLDIWGGNRRQVEGLRSQVDEQRYALAGTRVMIAGNVANTVIAQAAYRAETDATLATIGLETEQVRIAKAQAAGGTAPYSTVLTLQSQLASTKATLPPLEEKIDQAAHLLATLAGRTPAEWSGHAIGLSSLTLPRDLPETLPSVLVRQRPDILEAEAELHAANANIGVATAAMLPNLTLSGGLGGYSTTPGAILSPASTAWNVGAGLAQPVFHGGTLWYQRKAAIDARDQALAGYRQTVLSAFAQVADTLRGLAHDAEAVTAETDAVDSAEGALRLVQANYQAGIANYLQILTADELYLQAELGAVQAQAQRLQDTVALYVALGGGWWNLPADDHAAGRSGKQP